MIIEIQSDRKMVELRHLRPGDFFKDPSLNEPSYQIGCRVDLGPSIDAPFPRVSVVFFPAFEVMIYEGSTLSRLVEAFPLAELSLFNTDRSEK